MSDLKDPRVFFAAERTLLAWSRTSIVMIASGFGIERASILIQAVTHGRTTADKTGAVFWVGLAFIALGTFAAFCSSRQYLAVLKTLTPEEYPTGYGTKCGLAINTIVAVLGICLGIAVYVGHVS
ncbi:MAG: hypothetical protein A2W17_02025 [Planctomycetes bacterium RBG_16_41_13]|nr:MAG: hypothetical protein A2W17_02025 [Planctomycetes bacterium RBG_16_41_13]